MNSGVINDENYNFTSKEGLLEKLVKATYNGDGVFTKVDNIKAEALRLETYLDYMVKQWEEKNKDKIAMQDFEYIDYKKRLKRWINILQYLIIYLEKNNKADISKDESKKAAFESYIDLIYPYAGSNKNDFITIDTKIRFTNISLPFANNAGIIKQISNLVKRINPGRYVYINTLLDVEKNRKLRELLKLVREWRDEKEEDDTHKENIDSTIASLIASITKADEKEQITEDINAMLKATEGKSKFVKISEDKSGLNLGSSTTTASTGGPPTVPVVTGSIVTGVPGSPTVTGGPPTVPAVTGSTLVGDSIKVSLSDGVTVTTTPPPPPPPANDDIKVTLSEGAIVAPPPANDDIKVELSDGTSTPTNDDIKVELSDGTSTPTSDDIKVILDDNNAQGPGATSDDIKVILDDNTQGGPSATNAQPGATSDDIKVILDDNNVAAQGTAAQGTATQASATNAQGPGATSDDIKVILNDNNVDAQGTATNATSDDIKVILNDNNVQVTGTNAQPGATSDDIKVILNDNNVQVTGTNAQPGATSDDIKVTLSDGAPVTDATNAQPGATNDDIKVILDDNNAQRPGAQGPGASRPSGPGAQGPGASRPSGPSGPGGPGARSRKLHMPQPSPFSAVTIGPAGPAGPSGPNVVNQPLSAASAAVTPGPAGPNVINQPLRPGGFNIRKRIMQKPPLFVADTFLEKTGGSKNVKIIGGNSEENKKKLLKEHDFDNMDNFIKRKDGYNENITSTNRTEFINELVEYINSKSVTEMSYSYSDDPQIKEHYFDEEGIIKNIDTYKYKELYNKNNIKNDYFDEEFNLKGNEDEKTNRFDMLYDTVASSKSQYDLLINSQYTQLIYITTLTGDEQTLPNNVFYSNYPNFIAIYQFTKTLIDDKSLGIIDFDEIFKNVKSRVNIETMDEKKKINKQLKDILTGLGLNLGIDEFTFDRVFEILIEWNLTFQSIISDNIFSKLISLPTDTINKIINSEPEKLKIDITTDILDKICLFVFTDKAEAEIEILKKYNLTINEKSKLGDVIKLFADFVKNPVKKLSFQNYDIYIIILKYAYIWLSNKEKYLTIIAQLNTPLNGYVLQIITEHNKLESLVTTYLRIRCDEPTDYNNKIPKNNPRTNIFISPVDTDNNHRELIITGLDPNNKDENAIQKTLDYWYYYGKFTNIFNSSIPAKDVNCKELVKKINNKSIFIIGYGVSGSGKTSALIKRLDDSNEDGILLNMCKEICKTKDEGVTLELEIKELYNDTTENKHVKSSGVFKYKYNRSTSTFQFITNDTDYTYTPPLDKIYDEYSDTKKITKKITKGKIQDIQETFDITNADIGQVITYFVDKIRHVSATTNNNNSSRSHILIFINVTGCKTLVIGDLAGVENQFNCGNFYTKKGFINQPDINNSKEGFYFKQKFFNIFDKIYYYIRKLLLTATSLREYNTKFINASSSSEYLKNDEHKPGFEENLHNFENYKGIQETLEILEKISKIELNINTILKINDIYKYYNTVALKVVRCIDKVDITDIDKADITDISELKRQFKENETLLERQVSTTKTNNLTRITELQQKIIDYTYDLDNRLDSQIGLYNIAGENINNVITIDGDYYAIIRNLKKVSYDLNRLYIISNIYNSNGLNTLIYEDIQLIYKYCIINLSNTNIQVNKLPIKNELLKDTIESTFRKHVSFGLDYVPDSIFTPGCFEEHSKNKVKTVQCETYTSEFNQLRLRQKFDFFRNLKPIVYNLEQRFQNALKNTESRDPNKPTFAKLEAYLNRKVEYFYNEIQRLNVGDNSVESLREKNLAIIARITEEEKTFTQEYITQINAFFKSLDINLNINEFNNTAIFKNIVDEETNNIFADTTEILTHASYLVTKLKNKNISEKYINPLVEVIDGINTNNTYLGEIIEICAARKAEGQFINATLSGMRKGISKILSYQEKELTEKPNYYKVPPIKEECFEDYCEPGIGNCYELIEEDTNESNNLILDTIKDACKEREENLNDLHIAVFGVLNISDKSVSGSKIVPTIPYIDLRILKKIQHKIKNSFHAIFCTETECFRDSFDPAAKKLLKDAGVLYDFKEEYEKAKPVLEYIFNIYNDFDITIGIDTVESVKTQINEYNESTPTKLGDEVWINTLFEIIKLVSNINAISVIGTLDFLQLMHNENKKDSTCGYNSYIKEKFRSLDKLEFKQYKTSTFRSGYKILNYTDNYKSPIETDILQVGGNPKSFSAIQHKNNLLEYTAMGGKFIDITNNNDGNIQFIGKLTQSGGDDKEKDKAQFVKKVADELDNIKKTLRTFVAKVDEINKGFTTFSSKFKDLPDTIKKLDGTTNKQSYEDKVIGVYDYVVKEGGKEYIQNLKKEIEHEVEVLNKLKETVNNLLSIESTNKLYNDARRKLTLLIEGIEEKDPLVSVLEIKKKEVDKNDLEDGPIKDQVNKEIGNFPFEGLTILLNKIYTVTNDVYKNVSSEVSKIAPAIVQRRENEVKVAQAQVQANNFKRIGGTSSPALETDIQKATILHSNTIEVIKDDIEKIRKNVLIVLDNIVKQSVGPTQMSSTPSNIFSSLYNRYLETRNEGAGNNDLKASRELAASLHALNLIPREVLAVTSLDKSIFIFVTVFCRLFALSIAEWAIEKDYVKSVSKVLLVYLIAYTVLMALFVFIVNFDAYRMRIVFNYVNFHANAGRVYTHIISLWVFALLIYMILWNINLPLLPGFSDPVFGDEDKVKLMYRIEMLTAIQWTLLTILVAVI